MRFKLLMVAIACASPTAFAQRVAVTPSEPLPASCDILARVPASATTDSPALSAKVSIASCLASAKLSALTITDDTRSVLALEDAIRPSLALLDAVSASGNPAWQMIAEKTRGDLYVAIAVRMRTTLPANEARLAPRHDGIEIAIVPWFDRAGEAYGRVTHLASAHPELARDPYLRHLEAAASRQLRMPQTAARV